MSVPIRLSIWLLVCVCLTKTDDTGSVRDLTKEPGHMKRFGHGRPTQMITEMNGFPNPQEFFYEYVSILKPLKMKGAAKLSRAYDLWTDQYFLSLEVDPEHDEEVLIESKKKENRTNPTSFMTLKDFVKVYNDTDQYMVNDVPQYLRPDILVPCPLQCEPILKDHLIEALMWFSSGGTKSVVHTDAVENINCLFRGEKELIMVDPLKYGNMVDLDRPEGSYADIDVDAVDYTKYPGLADVEFYHVNMSAGDCLYIPFRWIHQVRSYGSNLAVNLWWDHYKFADLDPSVCPTVCDATLTIEQAKFNGFNAVLASEESMKDHVKQILGIHDKLTEDEMVHKFLGPDEPDELMTGTGYKDLLRQIFRYVDLDHDGSLTRRELESANQDIWKKVKGKMQELDILLQAIETEMNEKYRGDEIIDDDNIMDDDGNAKDEL